MNGNCKAFKNTGVYGRFNELRFQFPRSRPPGNNENPAIIAALVAAGADPKAKEVYAETPLHEAAAYTTAVVIALLKSPASVERGRLFLAGCHSGCE